MPIFWSKMPIFVSKMNFLSAYLLFSVQNEMMERINTNDEGKLYFHVYVCCKKIMNQMVESVLALDTLF